MKINQGLWMITNLKTVNLGATSKMSAEFNCTQKANINHLYDDLLTLIMLTKAWFKR